MSRIRCYVARKECGCIVAAIPLNMDNAAKAEILKQLVKSGFVIDQASDWEVQTNFSLQCDHNKPPLLRIADNGRQPEEDDGIEMSDVNAMTDDFEPEAEADEEYEAAQEERKEEMAEAEAEDELEDDLEDDSDGEFWEAEAEGEFEDEAEEEAEDEIPF